MASNSANVIVLPAMSCFRWRSGPPAVAVAWAASTGARTWTLASTQIWEKDHGTTGGGGVRCKMYCNEKRETNSTLPAAYPQLIPPPLLLPPLCHTTHDGCHDALCCPTANSLSTATAYCCCRPTAHFPTTHCQQPIHI